MPYLIQTSDDLEKTELRETLRQAHRDHLAAHAALILASGAILEDDGVSIVGGMTLLDTDDRATARQFADDDPYAQAGLHKHTMVVRWRRRWWEGTFQGSGV